MRSCLGQSDELIRSPHLNARRPTCPNTEIPIWSDDTHWATLIETIEAGWYGHVYVDRLRNDKDE